MFPLRHVPQGLLRPDSSQTSICKNHHCCKSDLFTPQAAEQRSDTQACAWEVRGEGLIGAPRRPPYPLHADAAPLQRVSNKRRLLGQRGAVAVTPIQLQERATESVKVRGHSEGTWGQAGGGGARRVVMASPPPSPALSLRCKHSELFPGPAGGSFIQPLSFPGEHSSSMFLA